MADNDSGEGLSEAQVEMVLQFQDFTGIDDMTVCRDVLTRHEWNLEVSIQEQLNIREGRPSVYATESRPPTVINDRFMQHIFTADTSPSSSTNGGGNWNIFGLVRYFFKMCYNALTSNLMLLLNMFRTPDRIVTDPLGDVLNFITAYNEKFPQHPVFYQGTYSQALNDAKRELRFLLVYLHSEHRNAAQATSLCRNALSNGEVVEYINRNMLFWACDVASPEGKGVGEKMIKRVICILEFNLTNCLPLLLSRLPRLTFDQRAGLPDNGRRGLPHEQDDDHGSTGGRLFGGGVAASLAHDRHG